MATPAAAAVTLAGKGAVLTPAAVYALSAVPLPRTAPRSPPRTPQCLRQATRAGTVPQHRPDHFFLLNRLLYGLKLAPRAYFARFSAFARTLGFHDSRTDPSPFVPHNNGGMDYLLLYIDYIILVASSTSLLCCLQ